MEEFPYPVVVEADWGCSYSKLKNKLQIYFLSRKKSNGGDCVVECDEGLGKVTVHFKSGEIREKVLEKRDHEIIVENETVRLRVSAAPKEPENEPSDPEGEKGSFDKATGSDAGRGLEIPQQSVVVLENIPENMSEDVLGLMVENISDLAENDFSLEMIYESNAAVVSFRSAKDLTTYLSGCKKNSRFQKAGLSARPLEQTRCVKVENLPPHAGEDLLELYFEKERVGGGKVENITMIPEEQAAIVTFLDPKVTETLQGKTHEIGKVEVKVFLYYKSIGAALYGKSRPACKLPEPFSEGINPAVWQFLLESNQITAINDELRKEFCEANLDSANVRLSPLPGLLKQRGFSVKHIENWKKNAASKFHDIMSKYKTFELEVTCDVWKMAEKEVSVAVKQDVTVVPTLTKGVVAVAGIAKDVDRLRQALEEIVQNVTRYIERETKRVSEEMIISQARFYILQEEGLQQKTTMFPELSLTFKADVNKLILSGLPTEVFPIKSWILESQLNMKEKHLEVDPGVLGFLSAVNSEDMSQHLFTSRGISAVYKVENVHIVLTGSSVKALTDAEERLKEALMSQDIVVEDLKVLTRPEWQILNTKLKEAHMSSQKSTVTMKFTAQDRITVSGFCEPVKDASKCLSEFINKCSRVEEAVSVQSPAVIRFIQEHKVQTWKSFVSSKDVEVVFELKRPKIKLCGSRCFVQEVRSFLQKMLDRLYTDHLKIVKPGAKKYFLEKQDMLFSMVLKDTDCLLWLQQDIMDEAEDVQETSLSTYCKVQMSNGFLVTVTKADLCQFQSDAVVNASNEELQHIGGLALALLRAAGPQLQDDCNEHVKRHGRLNAGDAIITQAGRLPSRYVIHAVGPRFSDSDRSTAVRLLRRAVRQSITLAVAKGCRSLAVPAISSGIFGFPLDLCAETIAGVVHEHCEDHIPGQSSLCEIHLVNHDEKTTEAVTAAVGKVFSDHQVWVMSPQKASPAFERSNRKRPAAEPEFQSQRRAEQSEVLERMCTAEGLRIFLRTGDIQDAPSSVIVNTISEDLDLTKGAVSMAIFTAAGQQMQSAVNDKTWRSRVKYGSVLITKGYKLRCEKVFHVVCPFWDHVGGKSEQTLMRVVQECLIEAEKLKAESLCFPALGTGNLGFPKDIVAKVMLCEVQKFSRKQNPKYLADVVFTLQSSDFQTIGCFRREFEVQKQGHIGQNRYYAGQAQQATNSNNQSAQSSGFFGQVTTPALGVHSMRVGNLTVEVSSGDITKQSSDVIVNSSNQNFSLKTGVSKAILEGAGLEVEKECARLGSQPNKGYIITQSGQLPCKCIIHIIGVNESKKIREVVCLVLQACEEQRFTSVSFPAIGTGAGGVSPTLVADAMIDAVVDFEKKIKGEFLKCVKILVFQTNMMADFHKSLKMREGAEEPEEKSIFSKIKETFTNVFGSPSTSTEMNEEFTIIGEEFEPAIFHICGESRENVSKAKSWIEDLIMKEQMEKTIKDNWIRYFTQEDCDRLRALQEKFTISIRVESRGADSLIHVEGLTRDVLTANDHIWEMIRKVESLERLKREASLVGAMVEWQHDSGSAFLPFDLLTNHTLEQAFSKDDSHVKVKINNLEFNVDLKKKEAVSGRRVVRLKRTVLKDISVGVPSDWDDMKGSDLLVVPLTPTSQEYQQVEREFRKTGLTYNIIKIERIQNSTLWKSYWIKKSSLDDKYKHPNNERQLFHGTCTTTIGQINAHGFNRSYAGRNAAVIGNGTYFAVDPKYSANDTYSKPDAQGQKNMYLSRVLVGEYTQGRAGLVVPPAKSSGNAVDLYDSVVDNVLNPQVFVIFNDVQAYPEYLITFS